MALDELQRLLKSRKVSPVIVLHGAEEWLRRRGVELVESAYKDLMVVKLAAEGLTWARVSDELLTASLFSPKKLVIVDDSEGFLKEHQAEFDAYAEAPSKQNLLVVVSEDKKPPVKEHRNVLTIACEVQPGYELEREIDAAVRETSRTIEPAASRELARRLGSNRSQWRAEIAKLIDYVGDRKTVTLKDVETLVRDEQEFQSFDLVNAIAAGQRDRALAVLHRLLDQGSAPQMLMGSLIWQYRKMAEVKLKMAKGQPGERACFQSGVRFRASEFARLVERTTEDQIAKAHRELLAVDLALKSSGQPEDILLDRLVVELTGPKSV